MKINFSQSQSKRDLNTTRDHTIKLFDLRKMETIYTLNDENIPHYCESNLSVSTDKKYFAIGSNKGEIYVFNLATGKVIVY
jgi:WD40 repeat protein